MKLSYDPQTKVLTVPAVRGVAYWIDGKKVQGEITLTKTTEVTATPLEGFHFPEGTVSSWTFEVKEPETPVEKSDFLRRDLKD